MKKIVIVVALVIIVPLLWYLISPLFNVVEADDAFPILDSMDSMDSATKNAFDQEVSAMADSIVEMNDEMDGDVVSILSTGDFMARAHEVSGRVLLADVNGEKILRFEDFDTVHGPELHIYLSTELGATDFVDLGVIKATRGNVNYELDSSIDTEKYNKVLVWCKPFGVLFSYAMLE